MTKKKLLPLAIAAALAAALLWYFRPQSIEDVTGIDLDSLTHLQAAVIADWVENGQPGFDIWQIHTIQPGDEGFDHLRELVRPYRFRASLRNLQPWPITSVSGDGVGSAHVSFFAGEDASWIKLYDSGKVIVSPLRSEGMLIYHITDKDQISQLFEYIKANGEKDD